MPEWLIILIVFFAVSRLVRGRSYGARCTSGRPHRLHGRQRQSVNAEARRAVPAPKPETPMEALQRRYVEGSISVEQYEAELDRLYRRS